MPTARPASTRREFLALAAATLVAPPGTLARQGVAPLTLANGVRLPSPWPPRRVDLPIDPVRPPYLASPPEVIPIDVGRQLFVDDFLVEVSALHRAFHAAEYHAASPVLAPQTAWERRDPHAEITGDPPSPTAMVFSDGVFYDPADRLFKMWYMAGYQYQTALAYSHDGVAWHRPAFDIVRGTNVVSTRRRDSTTVWLDLDTPERGERFKMAGFDLDGKRMRLGVSADGVHWREVGWSSPCEDRTTFFRNPFLDRWVFSLRAGLDDNLTRVRRYVEVPSFADAAWAAGRPVLWTGADSADLRRADLDTRPQLYNLDAVAYESVLLGLFSIYRGERADREKPNDVCVAFSRDGFHWSRESRAPFIAVSERPGDWNYANVQSGGGGCLVVGDRLFFYVSGRQGVPGTALPGVCRTGLATLRRDGFASLADEWPSGVPRRAVEPPGSLTTRPLRFSGGHLFVNADVRGELRVEVLDRDGRLIEPFSRDRAVPVRGDGTRLPVRWSGQAALSDLAGETVRLRFWLSRARLFAFWVSPSPRGQSRGYVAAGGPGFATATDA